MLSRIGLTIDTIAAAGAGYKIPTTLFVFLRVPLTHIGRWFAFTTKIPWDYICSLTNTSKHGFQRWYNQITMWCQRLTLEKYISYGMKWFFSPPFLSVSLFAFNLTRRQNYTYTVGLYTRPEIKVDRMLNFALMRSAFCRGFVLSKTWWNTQGANVCSL